MLELETEPERRRRNMPYKSAAQRRFFHTPGAKKAGITPTITKEWDTASKGLTDKKLPEKVGIRKHAGRISS
jgi:hypothetical protein